MGLVFKKALKRNVALKRGVAGTCCRAASQTIYETWETPYNDKRFCDFKEQWRKRIVLLQRKARKLRVD
jgi:hypothetical protein